MPGDVYLCAIAKALGKEPKDLLWPPLTTTNGHGKAAATTLELTDKRLKTLKGLTPYEAICKAWADQPDRFRYDPTHLTSGLNT